MIKPLRLVIFFLLTSGAAAAQNNQTYAEKAAALQKEIWGTKVPEFSATTVPANLSNESAVVFARSYSLQRSLSSKFKFMIITATSAKRSNKLTTFHERVKINDKSALEDFSTISYQKKLDESVRIMGAKFVATHETYIGAKIIKPNGKEVIVNTSEEVLIKNEKKDQQSKLAVPDLQVGDILDYYVSNTDISEKSMDDTFADNDMVFVLAGEYPILHYSLDFQYSKKDMVKAICANGAPNFETSTNDAGDQIYSLKLKNITKYESQLWTSKFRQFPYIEISNAPQTSGFTKFVTGGKWGESGAERLESNKTLFEKSFNERENLFFGLIEDDLKEYFDGKKNMKAAPLDSLMKVLYNIKRGNVFRRYGSEDLGKIDEFNYRRMVSKYNTIVMSLALSKMKIDHEVLLVSSRNTSSLENAFNYDDFDAGIRIVNGNKPLYMFFDDVTTHFNEIPDRFQGEKTIVLTPKRESSTRYSFTEATATLPVAPAGANNITEDLKVSLVPNTQKLKVQRMVKQTGALRHEDQRSMIPAIDVDNDLMVLTKGESLDKKIGDFHGAKKLREDFHTAFAEDASKSVKKFTAEIKGQFDQEPTQVADCKIINNGLDDSSPVFQYSSSFVLDNLVKKAGNNFIIDAGKLTGSFYKLEDKERKRTLDVYMPCARSFNYTVSITIPQGYTAKGVEEFAVKKANKTGTFTSSAAVNGSVLTISINRAYNNNFEKAADWPLVSEIIDAASNFNTQKILLEKK
ncbi:DUF3857 domain-containing protein [Mucilaginibacter sp. CAU 1740]|uniref:DUF3857 domain-containing protein n=1 Tax=Mucilaginibacter sp. CAU 1740 TaxID=3140365 RepID=UPI00325BCFBF